MYPTKKLTFRYGGASARVIALDKFTYAVSNVWSKTRHQGHASVVMSDICEFADANDITLRLVVQRYGYTDASAMDNPTLMKFYAKFGFVEDSDGWPVTMVRHPSQELHVP